MQDALSQADQPFFLLIELTRETVAAVTQTAVRISLARCQRDGSNISSIRNQSEAAV